MKRLLLGLVALLGLAIAPATHAQQKPIICQGYGTGNQVQCTTNGPPVIPNTGEPGWSAFGKLNTETLQLFNMFGPNSNLAINGGPVLASDLGPILNESLVLCTNVAATDNTLISNAIATGLAVHLRGNCAVTQSFTVPTSAPIYGDGDHITTINLNSTYPAGQNGVFQCTGAANNSCDIHDLSFIGLQPGTLITTAASTVGAGGTSFLVNAKPSGSGPWYIIDRTAAGIASLTTVTFSGASAPFTANLSAALIGPGVTTNDQIGITITRAGFAALGSCNASTVPCQYPPMIYDVTSGSRPRLRKLHMEGMWQCIDLQGATTANTAPWIDSIECDALSIGLKVDGGHDFMHIHGWHQWDFGYSGGFGASGTTGTPYADGVGIAMQIGTQDGVNANDLSFFDSRFVVTADASSSATPWIITNFMADGTGSSVEIAGGFDVLISGFYKTGATNGSTCPITVTAGTARISNVDITDGLLTTSEICVSGTGVLDVDSGRYNHNSTNQSAASVTSSSATLVVEDLKFTVPNTSFSAPFLQQTAGVLIAQNNFSNNTSGPCTAVSAATDVVNGYISNNSFVGCTYSFPASPLGNYSGTTVPMTWPQAADPTSMSAGAGAFANFPTSAGTFKDTAIGYQSMAGAIASSGQANVAVGYQSMNASTTGQQNTCVGSSSCVLLTTSTANTAVGQAALSTITTQTGNNTAVGFQALKVVANNANTAVGSSAGIKVTGSNDTILGANVCSTTLTSGSSNICIGTSSSVDTYAASTSNELNIGNAIRGGLTVLTAGGNLTSCGTTPALSATATDMAGTITTGTGATACTLTFAQHPSIVPTCLVTAESGTAPPYSTADNGTTATLILSTAAASAKYDYWCPVH